MAETSGVLVRHPLALVTSRLARALDVQEIVDLVLDEGLELIGAAGGSVALVADDGEHLDVQRARGLDEEIARRVRRIPVQTRHPLADVARTKVALWMESKAAMLEAYPLLAPVLSSHPRCAWVVVPLADEVGAPGVLSIGFAEERAFSASERAVVMALAACSASALRRARARERREDREILLAAFRQLPCAAVITDMSGSLIAGNEQAARLLGTEPSALAPRPGGPALETIPVRGEGRATRWIEARTAEVKSASDRPQALVRTFHDVTDRVCAAEGTARELEIAERTVAQLQGEIEITERLVAMLSHDLRTPLAAIAMAAEVLHRRGRLEAQDGAAVARIVQSAGRMQRLIEQVLDWARLRHGGLIVRTADVDLHAIVCEQIDEIETAFPHADVSLRLEGDGRGRWDGDRLAEVISNLVGNAIVHGAGAPIHVRVHGADQWVTIEVTNQGPPIASDVLPTIFDPFRRAPSSGGGAGTGLGLYITREIIAAHGGSVVASSSPEGTTFAVRIPRVPRDAAAAREHDSR